MNKWAVYAVIIIAELLVGWVISWAIILHDWFLLTAAIIVMLFLVRSNYIYLRRQHGEQR